MTSAPAIALQEFPTPQPSAGIWISADELAALPMSGVAWDAVKRTADSPLSAPPNVSLRKGENVEVLAKALLFARTGIAGYRIEVLDAISRVIGTEGSNALSTARSLQTYVVAADLAELTPSLDQRFREWLELLLDPTYVIGDSSLVVKDEKRPNNHGNHAGASRAAAAIYLGDDSELDRTALVYLGWLGDRAAYSNFKYGDLWWQCDPDLPVGVNPVGCTMEGHSIDGVLPDDQRRGGPFRWPPPKENYAWGGLQGAVAQAVILGRRGFDTWNWESQAILRAVKWLNEQAEFPAQGDDTWLNPVIDRAYGTSYWDGKLVGQGKNMAWSDWTHG